MDGRGWTEEPPWRAEQLALPREEGRISRGRMMKCFQTGEPFVVLQAAAGFGKTAVLAEYAAGHSARCCWLSLRECDNTFERFLAAFAAAVFPVLTGAPVTESVSQHSPAAAAERFLTSCFSLLPAGGLSICLDNFQLITDERIPEFLLRLCEYGAGSVRVLLAVRGSFPEFLSADLLRGRVRLVGAGELRLVREETQRLLCGVLGHGLSESAVARVQDYTGGWAAAVRFAGLELREKESFDAAGFDRTHLDGYISYEIFRGLACGTRQFLLDSAVLPVLAPGVCDYAVGGQDAEHMLEYLVREQLFVSRLADGSGYCYDAVFLEFLKSRQTRERREEILRRAAEYHAAKNELGPAKACALACGERGRAVLTAIGEKERMQERKTSVLSVTCLDGFSVRGEEGELCWRTKKTRELFACLFYEEGRRVTRDVLLERLWPDKPMEKALGLFHTTVSYLRRALAGAESVLLVSSQSYALDWKRIRSDLGDLRRWQERVSSGELPGDGGAAILALYRSGYLGGEDYLWLEGYPEELELEYLDLLGDCASLAMKRGNFQGAARYLKKAVQIDCYEIPLAERLVECLAASRDPAGARREYERLRRVCAELGIEAEAFEHYTIHPGGEARR